MILRNSSIKRKYNRYLALELKLLKLNYSKFLKTNKKLDPYDTVKLTDGTEQTLMPTHCVQYTRGAQFHPDLKIAEHSVIIRQGTNPGIDSYSAFCDKNNDKSKYRTILDFELKKRGITDLYICGLATDGCVGEFCRWQVKLIK
jgi:nicotinamidase/pyrazinamidase